jgi:putative FmdB family regulatory protein
MPLYEYECQNCGRFEALQSFSEKPLKWCPTCSDKGTKVGVQRVVSAPAFHLKGSGWYKTDYAAPSAKTPKGSSVEKSTPDAVGGTGGTADASTKGSEGTKGATPAKSCGTGCGCH